MGQKGKACGVRMLGLGIYSAQHGVSEWEKDGGLGTQGFEWGVED